jgi:hypothetical protein
VGVGRQFPMHTKDHHYFGIWYLSPNFHKGVELNCPPQKKKNHYWNKHILTYVITKRVIFLCIKGLHFHLKLGYYTHYKNETLICSKMNNIEYNLILIIISAKYDTCCKDARIKIIIIIITMRMIFFSKKLIYLPQQPKGTNTKLLYEEAIYLHNWESFIIHFHNPKKRKKEKKGELGYGGSIYNNLKRECNSLNIYEGWTHYYDSVTY